MVHPLSAMVRDPETSQQVEIKEIPLTNLDKVAVEKMAEDTFGSKPMEISSLAFSKFAYSVAETKQGHGQLRIVALKHPSA